MAVGVDIGQIHQLSLDEYHRLVEAGGFEGSRVELIDGLVVDLSPKTPEHEHVIAWLARRLITACDEASFEVRVAAPLTLGRSEPEPDLAVVRRGTPRPYHPCSAALVIEVAVSSQRRDLLTKGGLYAAAGIPEYWVVDLPGRRAICHRDPSADGYRTVTSVGPGETLAAAHVPVTLSVAALLDAAGAPAS